MNSDWAVVYDFCAGLISKAKTNDKEASID